MAAIYYLYNKMNTYQLSPEKLQKEITYIQEILKNNEYNTTVSQNTPRRVKLKEDRIKRNGLNSRTGKERRANTRLSRTPN
jgi:hypothetical protein